MTEAVSGYATDHLRRLVEAALSYAASGWRVLPVHAPRADGFCSCARPDCRSSGKHPRIDRWTTEATCDEGTVRGWWVAAPDANVGIATGVESGICALDVDPRSGGDASLSELERRLGKLPQTLVARTGGGGCHILFAHPGAGIVVRNAVQLGGLPGLDFRGDGGFIVAVPSRHSSGRAYEWDRETFGAAIAPMPGWLLGLVSGVAKGNGLGGATAGSSAPRLSSASVLSGVSEGKRDDGLFRYACRLRAKRLELDEAIELVLVAARRCSPPFPEADAREKVARAWRYSAESEAWPRPPAEAAFHGLAGEVVHAIEPYSEADPAALLVQFLVAVGNAIGRSAHFPVEADRHFLNLYCCLVGETAKGRKGTSWGQIRRLVEGADPEWAARVHSGLSSGEGLIWQVRDRIERQERVKDQGKAARYETAVVDEGISDKRLLVYEAEMALVIRVLARDTNTLSPIIRGAWDSGELRTLTKNSPARATGAHVSIIGHVTRDELRRHLDTTEMMNGFANRFLWICARRSKLLPDGGSPDPAALRRLIERVRRGIVEARGIAEMSRDHAAAGAWREAYADLSEGALGLLGAVTSRAEAQVTRLACLYAVLDSSQVVRVEHLRAGLKVWEYAEASARYIFGDAVGDPLADRILEALRRTPSGLSRTEIRDIFKRHVAGQHIVRALGFLEGAGLAHVERTDTEGRPEERWFALGEEATEATKAAELEPGPAVAAQSRASDALIAAAQSGGTAEHV